MRKTYYIDLTHTHTHMQQHTHEHIYELTYTHLYTTHKTTSFVYSLFTFCNLLIEEHKFEVYECC